MDCMINTERTHNHTVLLSSPLSYALILSFLLSSSNSICTSLYKEAEIIAMIINLCTIEPHGSAISLPLEESNSLQLLIE